MKLHKIKLHNFKSYSDCTLDLSNVEACGILGSNGSGKSTIIEAILWAIYGTAKLSNKDLVRSGCDYMYVELDLEIGDKVYEIEREYDDNVKLSVKVDGQAIAQGNRNLGNLLAKIVGAPEELLQASVVVSQGELSSFVEANPAERRDLVGSILGLDKYSNAWEVVKESLKTMRATVDAKKGAVSSLEAQLLSIPSHEDLDRLIKETSEALQQTNDIIKAMTVKREKIIAEDTSTIAALEAAMKQSTIIEQNMGLAKMEFQGQIAKTEAAISAFNGREKEIESLRASIPALEKEYGELSALETEATSLRASLDVHRKTIDNKRTGLTLLMNSEFGVQGTCPLCGSAVGVDKWQEIIAATKAELDSMVATADSISRLAQSRTPRVGSVIINGKLMEAKQRVSKLEGQQDSKQILLDQLARLKQQYAETMQGLIAQVQTIEADAAKLKGQRNVDADKIGSELVVLEGRQKESSARLVSLASTKQNRETVENAIKDAKSNLALYKESLPEAEFITSALSPVGIPLMITDYYLPLIGTKAQELLHLMSDGQLNLKVEITEIGNKRGIELYAGTDTLRPIRSLSGGESTRVSLALRVALSQVLQEMSGCRWDCLLIDEPEWLDDDGISQFIAAVSSLRGYYKQIFVISHIQRIKEAMPNAILVVKENGVSRGEII